MHKHVPPPARYKPIVFRHGDFSQRTYALLGKRPQPSQSEPPNPNAIPTKDPAPAHSSLHPRPNSTAAPHPTLSTDPAASTGGGAGSTGMGMLADSKAVDDWQTPAGEGQSTQRVRRASSLFAGSSVGGASAGLRSQGSVSSGSVQGKGKDVDDISGGLLDTAGKTQTPAIKSHPCSEPRQAHAIVGNGAAPAPHAVQHHRAGETQLAVLQHLHELHVYATTVKPPHPPPPQQQQHQQQDLKLQHSHQQEGCEVKPESPQHHQHLLRASAPTAAHIPAQHSSDPNQASCSQPAVAHPNNPQSALHTSGVESQTLAGASTVPRRPSLPHTTAQRQGETEPNGLLEDAAREVQEPAGSNVNPHLQGSTVLLQQPPPVHRLQQQQQQFPLHPHPQTQHQQGQQQPRLLEPQVIRAQQVAASLSTPSHISNQSPSLHPHSHPLSNGNHAAGNGMHSAADVVGSSCPQPQLPAQHSCAAASGEVCKGSPCGMSQGADEWSRAKEQCVPPPFVTAYSSRPP